MFDEENDAATKILVSFLVGGIVGAGLALLLAPQSGLKTRRQILDAAEDARDYAVDSARKIRKRMS